jgi:hypothetical protein
MNRVQHFILPVLFLIIALAACSTGPEFKRDNNKDPDSEDYTPNLTSINFEVTSDKNVVLNWTEESVHIDGYLIQKKLYDTYETLDTLKPFLFSYTDESKLLTQWTNYRIIPFVFNKEKVQFDSTNLENWTAHLDLGNIQKLNLTPNDSKQVLTANWSNQLAYSDGIEIALNSEDSSDPTWIPIDTLDYKSHEITIPYLETFSMGVRLRPFLITADSSYYYFSRLLHNITINKPSGFKAEANSDNNVSFSWVNNAPFDARYQIVHKVDNIEETFELGKNETSLTTHINASYNQHIFELYAVNKNIPIKTSTITDYYRTPTPKKLSINHESENSVKLSWPLDFYYYMKTTEYVIQRAVNNGEYQNIDTIAVNYSKEIQSYTDTNLNQDQVYHYRVKSMSSTPSQSKGVKYFTSISLNHTIPGGRYQGWIVSESDRTLYLTGGDPMAIYKYDMNTKYLEPLSTNENLSSKANFFQPIISPDSTHLAVLGSKTLGEYPNEDPFNYFVWIFSLDPFREINRIHLGNTSFITADFTSDNSQLIYFKYDQTIRKTIALFYDIQEGTISKSDTLNNGKIGYPRRTISSNNPNEVIVNMRTYIMSYNTSTTEQNILFYNPSANLSPFMNRVENELLFSWGRIIRKVNLNTNYGSIFSQEATQHVNGFCYIPEKDFLIFSGGGLYLEDLNTKETVKIDIGYADKFYYDKKNDQILISKTRSTIQVFDFINKWGNLPD